MRFVLFIIFIMNFTPAIGEDNSFSIFDKNFKGIPKQFDKIIIDGNLEDSCIKVLKSYEKAINQEAIGLYTLEIVKMIAPSLDFIKFCYKQRLIKK